MKKNVELKSYSSYKIGGSADYFLEAKTPEEIIEGINFAGTQKIPYLIIGSGTNILFSEKGYRGLIIFNRAIFMFAENDTLTADSGTPLSQVVQKIPLLTPLTGLPGTIGGAVYGNAGIPGTEIGDFVLSVEVYDPDQDKIIKVTNPRFSYRHSQFKDGNQTILRVTLKIASGSAGDVRDQLIDRAKKQPYTSSAGSFFKNPSPGKPSGLLIDQCGLKGQKSGDAQISTKHANFFVNLGNATQSDILDLAKKAKESVKSRFEIDLESEVQIISEDGKKIKV